MSGWLLARAAHGMLGVLAATALTVPALRPPAPGGRLPALLASGLTVGTFGAGLCVYDGYRSGVKHQLLAHAFRLAQAFEVKEHLAFCVVVLAVSGAGLQRAGADVDARVCYRGSALLAWVVVGIGLVVSRWQVG